MIFALVLGLLLGGAAVVLLAQWRGEALATAPARGSRLPSPRLPEPVVARLGGLVFLPSSRRRGPA